MATPLAPYIATMAALPPCLLLKDPASLGGIPKKVKGKDDKWNPAVTTKSEYREHYAQKKQADAKEDWAKHDPETKAGKAAAKKKDQEEGLDGPFRDKPRLGVCIKNVILSFMGFGNVATKLTDGGVFSGCSKADGCKPFSLLAIINALWMLFGWGCYASEDKKLINFYVKASY